MLLFSFALSSKNNSLINTDAVLPRMLVNKKLMFVLEGPFAPIVHFLDVEPKEGFRAKEDRQILRKRKNPAF